jgi:hypothetical protein
MASILEFRKSTFPFRSLRAGTQNGSADVVFFPGVRYERVAEEASATAQEKPRRRSKRRRDHLDLD